MSTTRTKWITTLSKTVDPVLSAMSEGRLQASMPSHEPKDDQVRTKFRCLEALGRSFAGIAPWLALSEGDQDEVCLRKDLLEKLLASMGHGVDEASPDRINFAAGSQILVDSAFIAQGFLRSWGTTWERLDPTVQTTWIDDLVTTRMYTPGENNWLLFAAMREALIHKAGGEADLNVIRYAFERHLEWYKGDGIYGDGPDFHWDYYNSYVIQPMLLDLLPFTNSFAEEIGLEPEKIISRARRYAAIQEQLISQDGTFPAIGRSITYRFGAFQHLGLMALRHDLPESITPAQVRCAMTAVLQATMDAPDTYDKDGWLNIGLTGRQPDLGEHYICCGSLYLTLCGFLPLGLPASDPFWADPEELWTSQKVWSGKNHPKDHYFKEP